jgi:hypothetical protein
MRLFSITIFVSFLLVGGASRCHATLATDCTLFAAVSGNDINSGSSPSEPKTLLGAAMVAQPGAVVCIEGGTYYLTHSFVPPRNGTANAYITYKAYGDATPVFVWRGGPLAGSFPVMVNLDSTAGFPNGRAYLKFIGFVLDGRDTALDGFFAHYAHHLVFAWNHIANTGGSGIGLINCDYVTSDHNWIWHNGLIAHGTSAISYNGTEFYDNYPGFHNIISNNVIAGQQDYANSDGNGIIFDLSANRLTGIANANTPPALIVNNVIFNNSGDCVVNYTVSRIWVVNNTCYKNILNTALAAGHIWEMGDNRAQLDWYVNNIVYTWKSSIPSYFNHASNMGNWYRNMYFVGPLALTPTNPSQFFNQDPKFVNPPYVNPTADGQWADVTHPDQTGFELQSSSPAIGKGVDPTTLPNVPAAILADLKKYIYNDIRGNSRPKGGAFDLGAFQH